MVFASALAPARRETIESRIDAMQRDTTAAGGAAPRPRRPLPARPVLQYVPEIR
jgi:hypothetical protein